jgi:type I pantothenate kinase
VATDGFLYPNAELEERGLLDRKGFPESYDRHRLQAFMAAVRTGERHVTAPVYSHERYDVVDDDVLVVDCPDILLLEGLHVLAPQRHDRALPDAVDFGVYLDADHADVAHWHLQRCLELYRSAGGAGRFGLLSEQEMTTVALWAWKEINQPNLDRHIAPTRAHADVVLVKAADHRVRQVLLADQSANRSTVTPASSSRTTRLTVAPSLPGSEGDPE